jgi:hypothetical protein
MDINIKEIKKNKLYKIFCSKKNINDNNSSAHLIEQIDNNENKLVLICIKIDNIYLPFNYQKYNNKYYLNAEVLKLDNNYNKIINLILDFENKFIDYINKMDIKELICNKKFISTIKYRERCIHLKMMLNINNNNLYLNTDIDISKLKNVHSKNKKYNIVINPHIFWIRNDEYGIIYYLLSIDTI